VKAASVNPLDVLMSQGYGYSVFELMRSKSVENFSTFQPFPGSILQNSISAENFSDEFSFSKFFDKCKPQNIICLSIMDNKSLVCRYF
jgi:hypothetical protein